MKKAKEIEMLLTWVQYWYSSWHSFVEGETTADLWEEVPEFVHDTILYLESQTNRIYDIWSGSWEKRK